MSLRKSVFEAATVSSSAAKVVGSSVSILKKDLATWYQQSFLKAQVADSFDSHSNMWDRSRIASELA
ncbi:hypothetical protein OXX69_011061, partial [Metschnikowia pulcherrima]